MKNWNDFFNQIRTLLESGVDEMQISADEALVNIAIDRKAKGEHSLIFSFDRITGKLYHVSAHPEV